MTFLSPGKKSLHGQLKEILKSLDSRSEALRE
jgi:hypothetical protein